MNVTKILVEMTICRIDGPFSSEASMLNWMRACLNCNTNNAAVMLNLIPIPALGAKGLSRIDGAFQTVNTLLDASGALESEPLQRAVYSLRLELARAAGDSARAMAAELSLQELNPVLAGLDLRTFDGWVGAAKALLADKPYGTALDDSDFKGYLVLAQGSLVAIPHHATTDNKVTTEWGVPVDGYELDTSIWSTAHQTWEAHDPVVSRDVLLIPKFVELNFVEMDHQ